MRDITIIELFNGETIRLTPAPGGINGELTREGTVVAAGRFASEAAARCWADAIIRRAARSSPRAVCVNCED